jgi:hypothetical protein
MIDNSMDWKTEFDSEEHSTLYDKISNLFSWRCAERFKVLETFLPESSAKKIITGSI